MRSLPAGTEAVVFDCDGLLVDTEACWTVVEAAIFAEHMVIPSAPNRRRWSSAAPSRPPVRSWLSLWGALARAPNSPSNSSKEPAKELSRGAAALTGGGRTGARLPGRPYP